MNASKKWICFSAFTLRCQSCGFGIFRFLYVVPRSRDDNKNVQPVTRFPKWRWLTGFNWLTKLSRWRFQCCMNSSRERKGLLFGFQIRSQLFFNLNYILVLERWQPSGRWSGLLYCLQHQVGKMKKKWRHTIEYTWYQRLNSTHTLLK